MNPSKFRLPFQWLVVFLVFATACSPTPVRADNPPSEVEKPILAAPTVSIDADPTKTTPIIFSETPTILGETQIEATVNPLPTSQAVEFAVVTPDINVEGTPVPVDENGLPLSHYIYGISGHKQYFPLGCEAAVTRDWALYFGIDINEFEFQHKLPLSDNPEVGFVGSVNSKWGQAPPYAYGVHAGPVAQLLQSYGMPATAVKGFSLTLLKQQIAADRPVIVWVIGNVVGGIPFEYTAKDGQKVIVAAYEHVVIVTGYNETHIRYVNNGKYFEAPNDVFLNSWKVLGNMALIAGA